MQMNKNDDEQGVCLNSNLKFKEAGTTNLVADFIQEERFKRVYDFLDHVEDMTWYDEAFPSRGLDRELHFFRALKTVQL